MRHAIYAALAALAATADAQAADVHVGPSRAYTTLRAGVAAAAPHDRILLDAGVYTDDTAVVDKPLTIEGTGAGATLRVTAPIVNRKGILVANADLTVRRIAFEGAHVTAADGGNGAGIRHQGGHLTVDLCAFTGNQNGILANPGRTAAITVRRSAFAENGAGDGYTHAIYAGAIARLAVTDSTFTGTRVGHNIKSRAYRTDISDTVLEDGVAGTSSYAIDLPNGGQAHIARVRVTQGPRTANVAMLAYGAEGALHADSGLVVADSTFVNLAPRAIAINNFTGIAVTLRNNVFQDVAAVARGPVRMEEAEAGGARRSGAPPS